MEIKTFELDLDPGGYSGRYRLDKLGGGRVCLDLINTIAWPGRENEHDWFDRWTNVVDWSVETGLLKAPIAEAFRKRYNASGDEAAHALDVIRHRRRVLRDVVSPLVLGENPGRGILRELSNLLVITSPGRSIDPDTLQWTWAEPTNLEDITAPVVLDAADLITGSDHTRLGRCPCGWLFYDSSRSRSRRWCNMEICGSRDKSLRYYHRKKQREKDLEKSD